MKELGSSAPKLGSIRKALPHMQVGVSLMMSSQALTLGACFSRYVMSHGSCANIRDLPCQHHHDRVPIIPCPYFESLRVQFAKGYPKHGVLWYCLMVREKVHSKSTQLFLVIFCNPEEEHEVAEHVWCGDTSQFWRDKTWNFHSFASWRIDLVWRKIWSQCFPICRWKSQWLASSFPLSTPHLGLCRSIAAEWHIWHPVMSLLTCAAWREGCSVGGDCAAGLSSLTTSKTKKVTCEDSMWHDSLRISVDAVGYQLRCQTFSQCVNVCHGHFAGVPWNKRMNPWMEDEAKSWKKRNRHDVLSKPTWAAFFGVNSLMYIIYTINIYIYILSLCCFLITVDFWGSKLLIQSVFSRAKGINRKANAGMDLQKKYIEMFYLKRIEAVSVPVTIRH